MGHFRIGELLRIHDHWGDDPRYFSVQLQCDVSRDGEFGGEAFSVTVVSPAELEQWIGDEGLELGRGYILMCDYDERRVTAFLQGLLDRSSAETWDELEAWVTRFFDWV